MVLKKRHVIETYQHDLFSIFSTLFLEYYKILDDKKPFFSYFPLHCHSGADPKPSIKTHYLETLFTSALIAIHYLVLVWCIIGLSGSKPSFRLPPLNQDLCWRHWQWWLQNSSLYRAKKRCCAWMAQQVLGIQLDQMTIAINRPTGAFSKVSENMNWSLRQNVASFYTDQMIADH